MLTEILVTETNNAFVFDLSTIENVRWRISRVSFRRNPAAILSAMYSKANGTRSAEQGAKDKNFLHALG